MFNNSFCKVRFLLFIGPLNLLGALNMQLLDYGPADNLLREKHQLQSLWINSEKLQIGKSLLPKLSLNLGQTVSTNQCDTQTWGAFGLKGTLLDLCASSKLKIADISLKEAKLSNNIELKKLHVEHLKNIVFANHYFELEKLLKKILKICQKLEELRAKGLEIGVMCQYKLEDLNKSKLEVELEGATNLKNFYINLLPKDLVFSPTKREMIFEEIINSLAQAKNNQTQGSELLELKAQKLMAQKELVSKQYLPSIDFGITTSNNHLYLFHKNWDLRAGITFKWDLFDFGSNYSQAESLRLKALCSKAEAKIAKIEENKVNTLNLIEQSCTEKKLRDLSQKLATNLAKIKTQKKLLKLGKTSLYDYLVAKKSILSEQVCLNQEQLQHLLKLTSY